MPGKKQDSDLTIGKTRRTLDKAAHILGDVSAVQKGTAGKRVVRLQAGRCASYQDEKVEHKTPPLPLYLPIIASQTVVYRRVEPSRYAPLTGNDPIRYSKERY